jgi:glycosyltransferase involved in cell wall biosynthesis
MTQAATVPPDLVDNAAFAGARPRLSVLIPFLRDDPCPLIMGLDREAERLGEEVELILLDDGTGDARLTLKVARSLACARLPGRLVSLAANEGRARGRNRLAAQARSDHFLFLDSDMRPDREDFLQVWLALIAESDPPMAFGGFSLKTAPGDRAFAVHRRLSATRECLSAAERALHPEKHVFTSNLMIRRDVFDAEAFDAGFTGWGWEDVEWAMRVGRRFPIRHVENPATHLGLDTAAALAGKYEQSIANFARVVARHPDVVAAYPSYRAARLIKRAPGHGLLRPLFKAMALSSLLPTAARTVSLRLYRAALYAEAV